MPETITAKWNCTVYEGEGGYSMQSYRYTETGKQFVAAGFFLPAEKTCEISLTGEWEKKPKSRKRLRVSSFEVLPPKDRDAAAAYLMSLKCGIGPATARILTEAFGEELWDVIEKSPERIPEVKGCRRVDLDKLAEKYRQTHMMRGLLKLFQSEKDVTVQRITRLAAKLGPDAVEQIRRNPYLLIRYKMGFAVADRIAAEVDFDRNRPERIGAAVLYVLGAAESDGHVCLPVHILLNRTEKLIKEDSEVLDNSEEKIRSVIRYLEDAGKVVSDSGAVYRAFRYAEECELAENVARLAMSGRPETSRKLEMYISRYESESGISLDPEQRQAILESFRSPVHIITGGPGTGKTTILKGILFCHEQISAEKYLAANPVLMAPTGRAARRMTEATGYRAGTIHRVLGLRCEDEEEETGARAGKIEAGIVIVDEASMIDSHLANLLFRAIPAGTRLIIVGDADQLPSVGCGNVLRELISCGCVSVSRLTTIHRQASGNVIISNSKKIREGSPDLDWADNFAYMEAKEPGDVIRKACALYLKCVGKYGQDNVVLLDPYRKCGEISGNVFNRKLQEVLNPGTYGQAEMKVGGFTFRAGDRVMQTKNTDKVSNGDVGYITEIVKMAGKQETICRIRFGDASVEYGRDDMEHVVLAYCTTIHKAQGAEYDTVIVVMHESHRAMLRRNILYTAVTRAKSRVALVGTWSAARTAILTDYADCRNTKLGARIRSRIRAAEKPGA